MYELKDINNGKIWAGKIINKSKMDKQRQKDKLMSEIKIHRKSVHKNIVKFEHVFED